MSNASFHSNATRLRTIMIDMMRVVTPGEAFAAVQGEIAGDLPVRPA